MQITPYTETLGHKIECLELQKLHTKLTRRNHKNRNDKPDQQENHLPPQQRHTRASSLVSLPISNTSINTLILRPVRQRLFCLAATSSEIRFFQRSETSKKILGADGIITQWITRGRLIPSLNQVKKDPHLCTSVGPPLMQNIFIERVDYPKTHTNTNHNL